MPDSVEAKIRKVEEDHALEVQADRQATHERSRRDRAMQMLGAAKYAEGLRAHSASQVIEFLMIVEDEKLYLDYDHATFASFLDESPLSELSKSSYYRMRDLYLKEGPERFDLLSEWKVSAKTRKLLTAGDIQIDGDEVVIGGEERVSLAEQKTIKAIIEKLVKEKASISEDLSKSEKKVEKQKEQIERGQTEFEELQRAYDSLDETPRFQRAVMQLSNSFFNLIEAVGELDDKERKKRANGDLIDITSLFYKLSDAYGVKRAIADRRGPAADLKPVDEMTDDEKKATFFDRHPNVLADDDDFGDEDDK